MDNLLILGAGGFGRLIAELAAESRRYDRISFLDDNSKDKRVVGRLPEYGRFVRGYRQALVAMGDNALRLRCLKELEAAGFELPVFVFRPAYLSPSAQIGQGSFVLPGAVVNTGAQVGRGAIINCGAVVDHEAVVGEGAHICLNAVVKSGCRVAPCLKVEAGQVVQRP